MDWRHGLQPDGSVICIHVGWHCCKVSFPWPYKVFSGGEFVRWSDENDPPFPCCCACQSCLDWAATKEEIDGPVVLPTS